MCDIDICLWHQSSNSKDVACTVMQDGFSSVVKREGKSIVPPVLLVSMYVDQVFAGRKEKILRPCLF